MSAAAEMEYSLFPAVAVAPAALFEPAAAPAAPFMPGVAPADPFIRGTAPADPFIPGAAPADPFIPGVAPAAPFVPGVAHAAPFIPAAPPQSPPRTEDAYCRMCASRAPPHLLQSFAKSNDASNALLAAVRRFNVDAKRRDGLPQVVCFDCIQRMEMVEIFLKTVTSAQSILTAMFMPEQFNTKLKREDSSDDSSSDSDCTIACHSRKNAKAKAKPKQQTKSKQRTKPKRPKKQLSKLIQPKIELAKHAPSEDLYNKGSVEITIEPDLPQTKVPIKSEDPLIRRWSDFLCCKRCAYRTPLLQQLREHSWVAHNRCIIFKCTECDGKVTNFKRFIRHMIKHQPTLEQCCEFCNEAFVSSWEVLVHKGLQHQDEARPHVCVKCGSTFNTTDDLQAHKDSYIIVKTQGAGDRRLKCQFCEKEFLNKITLQSHMDVHDPTKNVCTLCNRTFKTKYILNQHNETVHTGIVRFICQVCGRGFKIRQHLKRHMDVHNDVKPIPCGICHKRFRTRSQMKSHQTSHSEESTFCCHMCTKTYKFRAGLKDHLRSHNNERPYSCDTCERTFLSWSNYNKHMKAIHKKNMAKTHMNIMY